MSPDTSAMRVLFIAQLPPPWHGQSVMAGTFHENFSRLPKVAIDHRWGGGASDNRDIGRRSLRKYLGFGRLIAGLTGLILSGRRYDIAYLGMVPWAHTAIRDALLAFLARQVSERTLIHVHGDGLSTLIAGDSLRSRLVRRLLEGTEIIAITGETARVAERAGLFSAVIELPNLAADPGAPTRVFDGVLKIACLGNLDPRKGVLDFVDAVEAASARGVAVRASIVGGPTASLGVEQLRDLIASRDLADVITVTGRVSEEEKSEILSDSDVFLYLSRHDLAPLALIEALAHGCAPIVLRVGGIPEMVGPGLDHVVVDPKLVGADLAERAAEMLGAYVSDPGTLSADRARARARFLDNYGPERFRQRFLSLIQGSSRPSAGPVKAAALRVSGQGR